MSKENPTSSAVRNASASPGKDLKNDARNPEPSFASLVTNPDHEMSKAGRRRFNKEIRELRETFEINPALFERQWNRRVQGWLHEVHRRAKNWADGEEFTASDTREGIFEKGHTHVFGVVKIAETVMTACGPEMQAKLEKETLRTLNNECSKAVGKVVDARLNKLIGTKYRQIR